MVMSQYVCHVCTTEHNAIVAGTLEISILLGKIIPLYDLLVLGRKKGHCCCTATENHRLYGLYSICVNITAELLDGRVRLWL